MSNALEHRGPDAVGYLLYRPGGRLVTSASPSAEWSRTANVGLAHRRLSIIDLTSDSDQPLIDADARCALVYNGEIYNYVELRHDLSRHGHRFQTAGDAEVIIAAYREWGPTCVERFTGMWAFALLDADRNLLLLSRDRFGIKPLFYSVVGDALWFASEIKALIAGGVDAEPNPDALREFMLIGRGDTPAGTFFRGIEQLPPGHNALVDVTVANGIRPHAYWRLPTETRTQAPAEAAEEFAQLIRESVRLHMRADVEVGTCLSGGLDSSAIVALADELRREGAVPSFGHHGFGYVPADDRQSERRYMDAVVRRTGLRMTYVGCAEDRALQVIPLVAQAQDEPFGTASIVAQWLVFEAAHSAGIKVMLDGQGADEVLGGYLAYMPMIARAHLSRGHLLRYAGFAADHRRIHGRAPLPLRDAIATAVPGARRMAGLRTRALTPAAALLQPSIRGAWHRADEESLRPRSINAILARATGTQLPTLLRFEDRNSMTHSVESRVPFLDHRLVEFAFRLPGEQKIKGGVTKALLREGLAGTLPDLVHRRTDKIGFRADPEITWRFAARHRDALLRPATEYERRWFDHDALRYLIDEVDRSSEAEFAVWRTISAKLWLRKHWGEGAIG